MRPPIDPETEIIGQAMLSVIDNMQADDIEPILEKYHLTTIDPNQWYQADHFLNALKEIGDAPGGMQNLVAIGMAVAEKMVTPPEMVHAPLSQILFLWNDLYHLQHRKGQIGSVQTEKLGETHYRTIHNHLYPDDFTYGLAYGMARRFLPHGTHFKVLYDPKTPHIDVGGTLTIIDVMWD